MHHFTNAGKILWLAVQQYFSGSDFRNAAALAFYTVLALAPLLLVAVQVATTFSPGDTAPEVIIDQAGRLMGPTGRESVESIVTEVTTSEEKPSLGWLGVILSFVGATTVLVQLQNSLNEIWEVEPNPEANAVLSFVWNRVLSFALLATVVFLMLVSLIMDAGIAGIAQWLNNSSLPFDIRQVYLDIGQNVITFLMFLMLFAALFRMLPHVRLKGRDVLFGSLVTSFLFIVGKSIIGLYIGQAAVGSAYGAAGSLAALLTWVYYASALVLFGAEITRARAITMEHQVTPMAGAVFEEDSELAPDDV